MTNRENGSESRNEYGSAWPEPLNPERITKALQWLSTNYSASPPTESADWDADTLEVLAQMQKVHPNQASAQAAFSEIQQWSNRNATWSPSANLDQIYSDSPNEYEPALKLKWGIFPPEVTESAEQYRQERENRSALGNAWHDASSSISWGLTKAADTLWQAVRPALKFLLPKDDQPKNDGPQDLGSGPSG